MNIVNMHARMHATSRLHLPHAIHGSIDRLMTPACNFCVRRLQLLCYAVTRRMLRALGFELRAWCRYFVVCTCGNNHDRVCKLLSRIADSVFFMEFAVSGCKGRYRCHDCAAVHASLRTVCMPHAGHPCVIRNPLTRNFNGRYSWTAAHAGVGKLATPSPLQLAAHRLCTCCA